MVRARFRVSGKFRVRYSTMAMSNVKAVVRSRFLVRFSARCMVMDRVKVRVGLGLGFGLQRDLVIGLRLGLGLKICLKTGLGACLGLRLGYG
jgi:hypothetical protein